MSDAVITNLVIGSVGIVGVVGSLLAVFIQRKTSTDTTKMQFDFEIQKMIMMNKIIEIKKWIEPLRASLTDYSELTNRAHENIKYFDEYHEDFQTFRDVYDDGKYREFNEISESLDNSRLGLLNKMAQISDLCLHNTIDELTKIPVYLSTDQIIDKELFTDIVNRTTKAKDLVTKAFFRIEELLSGNFGLQG